MPKFGISGLTTFKEYLGDGQQLHESGPAVEVGSLNPEVLDAVHELGVVYRANPEYAVEAEGLGIKITNRDDLRYMPPLDYHLTRRPMNLLGHKLLTAFANQVLQDLDNTKIPNYIRVIITGSESSRDGVIPLIWHTDALVPKSADFYSEITADLPNSKRWVVGMVVDGEDDEAGNTEWIEGEIVLDKPSVLADKLSRYEDIFWSEPLNSARLTRDGLSIVRLALEGENPDQSLIHRFPDGVIGEIGTTTIHRGVLSNAALRVSLQCYFTQQ